MKLRRTAALLGVVAAALAVFVSGAAAKKHPQKHAKNFQHVFVIMMENTGSDLLIGNPNAPWINEAAHKYGYATNYYGVTHPSQPNYIAATSGQTGPDSDNDETVNVPNIVDQLEAHHKTWKAYMQSYSLCSTPTQSICGDSLYARKHNPFISYADVQSNPARVAHIVDYSQLDADLKHGKVANFNWISPDQCHDMHGRGGPASDPCSYSNEQQLIAAGDQFLQKTVTTIMASHHAWTGNSVIFVTWDESEFTGTGPEGFGDTSGCCDAAPGGGHVVMLVISHSNHKARQSNVAYNHYSMLSTIEQGWKLGCLGATCDKANVKPMTDLVGPRG